MNKILSTLAEFFASTSLTDTYFVGYSGGVDSHVLLHAITQLNVKNVKAIHINHGWSASADQWGQHCQRVCDNLSVPCDVISVNAQAETGDSAEAIARTARYQAFINLLSKNDVLLTAHTQSDQSETLLLQLFRGAGPKGLAAMPAEKKLGKGYLMRPLLAVTRDEVLQYAQHYQLKWIDDEANKQEKYTRNFLRHQVIPVLKLRWSTIEKTLSRSAQHCAESSQLLDELATIDLQNSLVKNGLRITELLLLSKARQRNVLRFWLQQHGFSLPSTKILQRVQDEVMLAAEDKNPLVTWENAEVRRYQGILMVMPPLPEHDASWWMQWDRQAPLKLPGGMGVLLPEQIQLPAEMSPVEVRFRQAGERVKFDSKKHGTSLKKFLQSKSIPPWVRDRLPLIFYENRLVDVILHEESIIPIFPIIDNIINA